MKKENKLTQQEVADMLGIDRSNYSKYELNKLQLNPDMLAKLAATFNETIDYLVLGIENK